ncbi:hypothetical protein EV356DRAFT_516126 [Viridothelium virens]|uniref:histidine kinase n=1 Tax=Viridothelium virens TaxID=1048519 RepID=A0A6A6H6Z2_VIRVR|nr:hypothetical protein EV356DRAFT_516126 [Viridothelium virens]
MRKTSLPSPTPNINTSSSSGDPATPNTTHSYTATSPTRPQLKRQNPDHTRTDDSASPQSDVEATRPPSLSEGDNKDNDSSAPSPAVSGGDRRTSSEMSSAQRSSVENPEIERLREAVRGKMLQGQQNMKKRDLASYSSPTLQGTRRVSPIKEEMSSAISPSLDAAFNSPLTATTTSSTESTESARTIRGSVPATPGQQPLRTPSYPFPYVPGTPLSWSSSFHQPFTALSPTVSTSHTEGGSTPRENIGSDPKTPAPGSSFIPQQASELKGDNARFPSPSLYDLTLALNAEPGLDAWWNNVASTMNRYFMAERITLSVPADPSDLENVPWGQKATFDIHQQVATQILYGRSSEGPSYPEKYDAPPSGKKKQLPKMTGQSHETPTNPSRPSLKSRHSYAGHERLKKNSPTQPKSSTGTRPEGPQRTASHAPSSKSRAATANENWTSNMQRSPSAGSSMDPDTSNLGGEARTGPALEVYPILRALDTEQDALIDTSGVNRILERGRLVTLTRDYASNVQKFGGDGQTTSVENTSHPSMLHGKSRGQASGAARFSQHNGSGSLKSNHRHLFSNIDALELPRSMAYEEYEQYPASPWAQSPAPSPAVQADPDENPFFAASGNVDEESFNPTDTGQDYSRYGEVEAIGVDRASTVTHVPLVHPILSQNTSIRSGQMAPDQRKDQRSQRSKDTEWAEASSTPYMESKAPIAILSILSPTVPYPHNLTQSLKLLGPHLATSYSNASQYTSIHSLAIERRHRQRLSGHHVGFAPVSTEAITLENLKYQLDVEDIPESISESLTSPSDYSGRSRHSPGGSLTGTPGWENMGFPSNRSRPTTPHVTGADYVDSYFDSKKKLMHGRSESVTGTTSGQLPLRSPGRPNMSSPRFGEQFLLSKPGASSHDDDTPTPRSDEKNRMRRISHEKSILVPHPSREGDLGRQSETTSPRKVQEPATANSASDQTTRRPHSLLHSYGADFATSFQNLPAATTNPRTPNPSHSRSGSMTDDPDMPPPSERLLRTIIDALPVQIFTAAPGSGVLTWVNTKFLVYRGQDPREVLEKPWDAIHPEDKDEYMNAWQKSLSTGQQFQHKIRLQRFDGSYRWFYARAAPLKDKRQNIVHWIGTNMDFHEQHIAELNSARQQETAASEAKYRALANSSPQIVFAVTRSKGVIFCNTQWVNYSGQSEANALGLGFMEMVHPDDIVKCKLPTFDESGLNATNVPTSMPPEPRRTRSSLSSSDSSSETERQLSSPSAQSPMVNFPPPQIKLSRLASTGFLHASKDSDGRPSYSTEVRLRSRDGDYRWHLVRIIQAEPIAQTEANEETWYGTCTDINAHKALEHDMKESMDAKTRFLSNMSHEIRTPLNGITGMVNFLIDSRLTAEQMEHVSIIKSSTEGLRDLINDILDLSKAEAGAIKLVMDWIHIRSLIEEVNDLTSALAIDKGLELNYLVEEDVPYMVKGDRFRLRQVLLNVVGNAIKFTERGEIFVRCEVYKEEASSLQSDQTLLLFEVIDTGSGFTPKEAEALFKRFSQIDGSSTRQHGGTGLGLVISKQLVNLHGGEMTAKGEPGKGSTFTFSIKFATPTEDDKPPSTPFSPSTVATPLRTPNPLPFRGPTISPPLQSPRGVPDVSARSKIKTESPVSLSPATDGHESSSMSSGSSDPSIRTQSTSLRSERSSVSSIVPVEPSKKPQSPIKLELPSDPHRSNLPRSLSSESGESAETARPGSSLTPRVVSPTPPVYSILVVCPLVHSQTATVRHIQMTLPKNIPHAITARNSFLDYREMGDGPDPPTFSHIVLVLKESNEVMSFMEMIFGTGANSTTSLVIICDLAQKREIVQQEQRYDFEQLTKERRLRFIFKPLKPSKFAVIFDPQKEREVSTDRNQDSAQQVADKLAVVNAEMMGRLGNKGHRVLLVEDNHINQMVLIKLFKKCKITCETVFDGVQCTEKVFSKPHNFYTIILCDLHMPNKDGYQTCREIRRWERQQSHSPLPIIALSANVLGDVYAKCAEVGFNAYVTKPVEFEQLKTIMVDMLDPEDKSRPLPFMKIGKHRKGERERR